MHYGEGASLFNESRDGPSEAETINLCKEQLKDDWHASCYLAQNHHEKLTDTHEIERFDCDADEITAWIIEKDVVISSDKFGRCSYSVQTFHRKHLERDLAALGEKIMTFGQEAVRLCGIHPDRADQISAKCQEIVNNWERLSVKAKELKLRSDECYPHQFHSEFRDLVSWIYGMKAVMAADKLANNVADAKALLTRHHERKDEIDAREDRFRATIEAGRLHGENDHWFAADVSEKLIALSNEKQYLMTLWEERRMLYEHCIYLLIKETEEAGKNPPYSADDQESYFSDEEEWDRSRSLALFPHVDRLPEETRKQYALSKLEMARCALIPGMLKGVYENAKLELKFAEHAFPMEETKKMLEQLTILEQTSRTETN